MRAPPPRPEVRGGPGGPGGTASRSAVRRALHHVDGARGAARGRARLACPAPDGRPAAAAVLLDAALEAERRTGSEPGELVDPRSAGERRLARRLSRARLRRARRTDRPATQAARQPGRLGAATTPGDQPAATRQATGTGEQGYGRQATAARATTTGLRRPGLRRPGLRRPRRRPPGLRPARRRAGYQARGRLSPGRRVRRTAPGGGAASSPARHRPRRAAATTATRSRSRKTARSCRLRPPQRLRRQPHGQPGAGPRRPLRRRRRPERSAGPRGGGRGRTVPAVEADQAAAARRLGPGGRTAATTARGP